MRLHVVQAFEGDCLILETGDVPARFLLIDGGPDGVFEAHLRPALDEIVTSRILDAAIVSHVDADHIVGVLDLLADLERADADGEPRHVRVDDLWHNAFSDTVDDDVGTVTAGVQGMLDVAGAARVAMTDAAVSLLGVREGVRLRRNAQRLGIPINGAFVGRLASPDELDDPTWRCGEVVLTVVGPTDANLRTLRTEWLAWLDKYADAVAAGSAEAMANADKSIPNLSSIVLLARSDNGATMLLTGDARGDHILEGLDGAGLLDASGRLHVDLLKVQHHGSDRNATRDFFRRVTAGTYVISANGKHDNPDYETLTWLVETAHEASRAVEIVCTNRTPSLERLLASHPPDSFGYRLRTIEPGRPYITIDLPVDERAAPLGAPLPAPRATAVAVAAPVDPAGAPAPTVLAAPAGAEARAAIAPSDSRPRLPARIGSFYDLFNVRVQRSSPGRPARSEAEGAVRPMDAGGARPSAASGREGVFVSRQSITSFAVASSIVTIIWKAIGALAPSWGSQVWVAFVIAFAVGAGLYLIHVSDPERAGDTQRDRLIDGFIAIVNSFVLFASAMGLGQIAGGTGAPPQDKPVAGLVRPAVADPAPGVRP